MGPFDLMMKIIKKEIDDEDIENILRLREKIDVEKDEDIKNINEKTQEIS